jgi:hypothetical protein
MVLRDPNHIPFHKRPKPAYLLWIRPEERSSPEMKTLLDYDGYRLLHTWHSGRCAMCGRDREKPVLDHCHETGLARGFLCSSCNTKEANHPHSIEWEIYRKFPPASLLGVKFYYNDFGQSPYPVEHVYEREKVDVGVENWSDSECFELIKLFCNYKASLNWINSSELRTVIRKSIAHVMEVSSNNEKKEENND